ncbi:MAG: transpeptidase family protein [Treponema sp.]|jgi:cell division protein FtsI (penicillin-binding protein 3)|nr:transpeptidase family protein [Treponema sp.]
MNLKRRYFIVFSILILFSLYLLGSYIVLMVGNELPPAQRPAAGFTERGAILDRNGRFLALQIRFADVAIWRPSITDMELLTTELADILEMTPSEIQRRIGSSESNFLYLKRQIDDASARRLSSLILEKKIRGVMVQPIVGRLYPEKNLASQVIGFVGDRNRGLEGIEFAFNNILDGIDDSPSSEGRLVSEGNRGSQVFLTIDTYVQHILEQIAIKTKDETNAEAVMLLAMDPRTGDILGSVSLPDFDPNNIRASNEISRMNRPVIWAYEPGSVFKVFSLAALMDSGAVSGGSTFVCNGVYERVTNRGERIVINCLGAHGRVSAREIIVHSCNAGAAHASEYLNNSSFYHLLNNYGFGSRSGAGSPGETAGYLVQSENWSERSKPTLAIGQEIAVSAYQMLQAASAIANDGILVPPRVVSRIVSPDGVITPWEGGASRRILRADTARAMRSYMVDAASGIGTGWRAAVEDLSLAVKTGTAQIIDPVTRRYSQTDFIASCIALLPAESPSLILYLAIIKPQGEIFGGRIAAPAIREAAESLIDYLGIPRGRNPQISHPPSINIPASRLPAVETHVPDFTGLAKRMLLPLLLRDDITVEIRGDGWVRRQSPPYGTPVTSGMTIILELE